MRIIFGTIMKWLPARLSQDFPNNLVCYFVGRTGIGFFTSSGIFQKVTEKSRRDSKFFKKSLKKVAEVSKIPFLSLIFNFLCKKSLKKSLRFQKSTFYHWFSKHFFRNFPEFRLPPYRPVCKFLMRTCSVDFFVKWISV